MFGAVLNRLATSVRRALSQYVVGANEPELALNFIDNEYITNNSTSTFASAVTHARAGNATMTDGYGPEVVSFDNASNWTLTGSATISDGKLVFTDGATGTATFSLSATQGKQYVASIRKLVEGVSGANNVTLKFRSGSSNVGAVFSLGGVNGPKTFEEIASPNFDADAIQIQYNGSGSYEYAFDNVSVREMPVIKWAPHNYQNYSDDVSQGSGSTGVTRTATTLTETTSTSEHRIQCGIAPPVVGEKYTMALEAKSGTGSRNIAFRGYGEGGAEKYPVFDIVNGTVRQTGTSFTDVSITDVGDGYYLCKASVVPSSAFRWAVHMADETATLGNNAVHSYTGDGSSSVLLRKLRQYRSDLGGMVDNPDNSGNNADFIATSGSAAYLPRIGHHVYNGNAWVNEGVLAESESRVNLIERSNTFDSVWIAVSYTHLTLPTNREV